MAVDYDVIIAGGGIAGISTAAALREFGWSVLIVEPGQHTDRRLGGELIHPSGLAALTQLGVYGAEGFGGAVQMCGFAVFPGAETTPINLPYANGRGIALDHGGIRAAVHAASKSLPHVTTVRGRVVGMRVESPLMSVAVRLPDGIHQMACRLVVSADGASSAVRSYAGILHTRKPISTITGYTISSQNLPAAGFGHVFVGSLAPLLVYEIGGERARILFDHPLAQSGIDPAEHRERVATAVPHTALRAEIRDALATQSGLCFVWADTIVARATCGRVALVGDAGGSCHPLTASGMTIGATDALRLRDALRDTEGDIELALRLYAGRRRAPQRTRLLVSSALHEVWCGNGPESQLMRRGLVRYWSGARERRDSMSILALNDVSFVSAVREMLLVIYHGLVAAGREWSIMRLPGIVRGAAGLATLVIRQMSFAMRAR
jgi:2-polyprenyl-6-methoxyphenol hydroxylase-like FAD-dependent oxidoreductase